MTGAGAKRQRSQRSDPYQVSRYQCYPFPVNVTFSWAACRLLFHHGDRCPEQAMGAHLTRGRLFSRKVRAEATRRTRDPHVTRAKQTHETMKKSIVAAVISVALVLGGVFLFAQTSQTQSVTEGHSKESKLAVVWTVGDPDVANRVPGRGLVVGFKGAHARGPSRRGPRS